MLNKFRGDARLLAPAPQMLQEMTGVPVVATLPMWWRHGLPEEDGVFDMAPTLGSGVSELPAERAPFAWGPTRPRGTPTTVAVIAYPRMSNLDEFQPLKNVPGVRLLWARTPADCAGADCIVLPGSKATAADLAWLRAQGLDQAVAAHAAQGQVAHAVLPHGLGWQNPAGNVLGCYLHGLFEDPAMLRALFGTQVPTLETVFDGLADFLTAHVEPGVLDALVSKG